MIKSKAEREREREREMAVTYPKSMYVSLSNSSRAGSVN